MLYITVKSFTVLKMKIPHEKSFFQLYKQKDRIRSNI